jgi:prepilin-type N-terminal cleavage/methylation domain-containing protein
MNQRRGFTLIELLVVTAIIAVGQTIPDPKLALDPSAC